MKTGRRVRAIAFACIVGSVLLVQAHIAFAQAYVPVQDIKLNPAFASYVTNLFSRWDSTFGAAVPNGTTDSLRDLISGSNPGGLASTSCVFGDNWNPAFAYTDGAWAAASASSSGAIPTAIPAGAGAGHGPYVQINYSNSLRCLLKEVVEWQKLSVSIQIHQMLKTYIADAQMKQLNNQLKNRIASANLDHSRSGNVVNNSGVVSTEALFRTNPSQSQYNVQSRQLEHTTDQAAEPPNTTNPVGSLGIASPWRLDTAKDMTENSRGQVEDPFFFTQSITEHHLTDATDPLFANENDWLSFSDNFNDPASLQGGFESFRQITANPANNPIGASTLADEVARGRLARQADTTRQKESTTGFVPTTECDQNDPADPHCLDRQYGTDKNPADQNRTSITENTQQGDRQVEQGMTLDSQGGPASENQSTTLNTDTGLLGYDTTPLATSTTAVNDLVREFYDTINYGYFGITQNTTEWAQATMLMIYDEMKFNDQTPATIVTDGTAEYNTGY